jgi:choline dehydrogenase
MKARSAGGVTLADRDPQSPPLIDHRYLTDIDAHDLTVLSDARELMAQITSTPAFTSWLGQHAGSHEDRITDTVVSYCHPAGGCRLGATDEPAAVVGPDGAVYGVDGLTVADASLMPTITRGNINLPTAAHIAASILQLAPAELAAAASERVNA